MYAYAQAGSAPAHHYAPPPPPTYLPHQFTGDPSALGAAAAATISQHHLNQHAAAHLGGLHHMTEPQLTELTTQSKRRR